MLFKAFAPLLAVVTACPHPSQPPRQLPVEPGPAQPITKVRKPAEAIFGRPDEAGRWMRLREVRFEEGKTFGWRIRLPCRQPVEYHEVMRLPSPGDFTFELKD